MNLAIQLAETDVEKCEASRLIGETYLQQVYLYLLILYKKEQYKEALSHFLEAKTVINDGVMDLAICSIMRGIGACYYCLVYLVFEIYND